METHRMLDHIRKHSIMVERIATMIARGIREAGVNISLEKVTAGALMHDIAKAESLETGDKRGSYCQGKNHLPQKPDG